MAEQRLIDANKIEYENIYVYPTDSRNYRECVGRSAKIREAETVLTIPENPTNGDMVKAMFPEVKMWGESEQTLDYSLGGMVHRVTKSWWNAPYNRETEVEPNNEIDDIRE